MLPHDPEPNVATNASGSSPADPLGAEPTSPSFGAYELPPRPVTVTGPPRRSVPVLAVAVALVAILAGGALFMSGYLLGGRRADQPGTPATDDAAFQPFWDAYRQIVDRYAGGEVDKDALIEGA